MRNLIFIIVFLFIILSFCCSFNNEQNYLKFIIYLISYDSILESTEIRFYTNNNCPVSFYANIEISIYDSNEILIISETKIIKIIPQMDQSHSIRIKTNTAGVYAKIKLLSTYP